MKIVRMANLWKVMLLLILGVLLNNHGFSQPSPDQPFGGGASSNGVDQGLEDPGDPGDPGEDPDLPLDSNVLLLVAAGVGYGLKKSWDLKQKLKKDKLIASSNTTQYTDFIQ